MISHKTAYVWFIVLFVFSNGALFAQDAMTFNLRESIAYALAHSPEIAIADKEFKKAEKSVLQSYSSILPQLEASASYQRSWAIQESTIPNFIKTMMGPSAPPGMPDYVDVAFGLKNSFRYGATVTQPLFLGGAGIAKIQSAYAARRAARQNLKSNKQELIYETVDAFYNCLLTQELVKVQKEALMQARANLDVVTKKYGVGSASGFDKMRAEVEVANLKPQLISAENNHKAALTRFRTVLGLPEEADATVQGSFRFENDAYASLSQEELQDMAIRNRPELQSLQERQRITEKGITIARSRFLPKLIFQTDYSYMAMKDDFNVTNDDFNKGFNSSVRLQIPIFSGFKNTQDYQKAKLEHKIVKESGRQARQGILGEVEIAFNKFREALEKYQSAKETVSLAEEALRLANLMYDEGANTQLDVLNSRLSLTKARMTFVQSVYEYQVARYRLRKATGTLDGIIE